MSLDYTSNYLHVVDVQARLQELIKQFPVPPYPNAPLHVLGAFAELQDLLDIPGADLMEWPVGGVLVNQLHWTQHCELEAYRLGDIKSDSAIAAFVNWEKLADRIAEDFQLIDMPDEEQFYVRKYP